jgi:lysophospholipase L1-like esterase
MRCLLPIGIFAALSVCVAAQDTKPVAIVESANAHLRGSLQNCLHRFEYDKIGHVAFLGGSITEMNGYRPIMEKWLTARFPETKFTFTNAGISSTCSHTGAFRLQRDVLSKGPVDLLLVEFAVNDDQDAHHTADDCTRGMEGIIRHTIGNSPMTDIVMIHFVNPEMLATAQAGKMQLSATQHEAVAKHYIISSVNMPAEVANRIKAGTLTWDQFGGTHPGPIGNQLAADLVAGILIAGWKDDATKPTTDALQKISPLIKSNFEHGHWLSHDVTKLGDGWTRGVPDWKSIAGGQRERFNKEEMLFSEQPGATLTLTFDGTAIGAFVLAGPDAGQLEVQIDGGDWKSFELYHGYSAGLHYPRTVMFATDLQPESHQVNVRIRSNHNEKSKGHAARILSFVANGPG